VKVLSRLYRRLFLTRLQAAPSVPTMVRHLHPGSLALRV
jgi:hypothetical protein